MAEMAAMAALVVGSVAALVSATLICVWRRSTVKKSSGVPPHQSLNTDSAGRDMAVDASVDDAEWHNMIDSAEEHEIDPQNNDDGYDEAIERGIVRGGSNRASQKSSRSGRSIHDPVPMDAYNDSDSDEDGRTCCLFHCSNRSLLTVSHAFICTNIGQRPRRLSRNRVWRLRTRTSSALD
jgi:hypothetical protein